LDGEVEWREVEEADGGWEAAGQVQAEGQVVFAGAKGLDCLDYGGLAVHLVAGVPQQLAAL
jgi:hypothetical protein